MEKELTCLRSIIADCDERITAEEIADLRGTINYEVTCNFGARLEKVYI